ncbi:MAG: YidC/Oxa1 family membrane protein insertase [Clostridium sp.]|nr:YidC/Oxa1 family membrane protein insertase [Clostridium sp.]
MSGILLTQYDGAILGPIAKILGYIMDGIFRFLNLIGIPNIGLAIILFTIVIYILLLPLTIKQQKFSKLSAKMNPELQAIRKKYEGKKDNVSMNAMNLETQEVYAKYGVSPSGSCVQLLIQMPILFALYRVIYAIPAYVPMVKDVFTDLVDKLILQKDLATNFLSGLTTSQMYSSQFTAEKFVNGDVEYIKNTFIDCLNRANTADWANLKNTFGNLSGVIDSTLNQFESFNNFLGLNIGNSPSDTIRYALSDKNWALLIGAIMVPVLAALSQWINAKLMPSAASSGNSENDTMAQSMKVMNTIMPLMSAWFCYTLPVGMGIYWIAGAVVRSVQQVIINKKLDTLDFDAIIEQNKEKAKAKMQKQKEYVANLNNKANVSTRNINSVASKSSSDEAIRKSENNANVNKSGSLASKANMVKRYNERNN